MKVTASFSGADGQPIVYPVPLVVRNTFIDCQELRTPSLDGFFHERQVASCPASKISDRWLSSDEEATLMEEIATLTRSKTVPNVPTSALGGGSHAEAPGNSRAEAGGSRAVRRPRGELPEDGRSDCSTADTAELTAPPSPASELVLLAAAAASREAFSAPVATAQFASGSYALPPPPPQEAPAMVLRLQDMVNATWASHGTQTAGWALPANPTLQREQMPLLMQMQPMHPAQLVQPVQQPCQEYFGLGSLDNLNQLPSMGSVGHHAGDCKPCAFLHSKGCVSGKDCQFCHLCDSGEKKRRQKDKKAFFGSSKFGVRQFVADSFSSLRRW
eukprot:CAMPEP_0115128298 /NCGR_PEP_ID=MMETSP0227-20121206/51023_1 /TAXON_ID=89957 /ORGANISM="Polarella glacialis, Strain CCMP 1383" /LENGTH=329 /DNA_ID=CAMNT_0002532771 /DNA_START=53 /DNA_END=1042 /DNA_ORIENTATION=+